MTRILSLDDEPEILSLIGLVFELAGYEHLYTTNNTEALAILHNQPIDLFTQDLLRPDMDGWEFYQIMKADEELRSIPVLCISATFGPANQMTAFIESLGEYRDDYVAKPWGPEELLPAITRMMKRHGKHIPTDKERVAGHKRLREGSNWSIETLDDLYKRITKILNELNVEPKNGEAA
jgi:CheY-like chemotaxis protein